MVVALHDDAHAVREVMFMTTELNHYERQYLREELQLVEKSLSVIYDKADFNTFITRADLEVTQQSVPPPQVLRNPRLLRASMPHTMVEDSCIQVPFEEREGYVFVGNGANPSNIYSISWFLTNVWPLIRAFDSDAVLYIVGDTPKSGPQCKTRNIHCSWTSDSPYVGREKVNGIEEFGKLESLDDVLCHSRVLLSPIRVSTGVNTKGFLAYAYALPLIATIKGALGLSIDDIQSSAETDTPLGFAMMAQELHNNKTRWTAARQHKMALRDVMVQDDPLTEDLVALVSELKTYTKKQAQPV